mmetsp:Transcript_49831/g.93406  ORF Transcript_49831/g.93406 Transcript_49831/m.93406 type:complete len:171 (-) Transcript_49831:83-595(-)
MGRDVPLLQVKLVQLPMHLIKELVKVLPPRANAVLFQAEVKKIHNHRFATTCGSIDVQRSSWWTGSPKKSTIDILQLLKCLELHDILIDLAAAAQVLVEVGRAEGNSRIAALECLLAVDTGIQNKRMSAEAALLTSQGAARCKLEDGILWSKESKLGAASQALNAGGAGS